MNRYEQLPDRLPPARHEADAAPLLVHYAYDSAHQLRVKDIQAVYNIVKSNGEVIQATHDIYHGPDYDTAARQDDVFAKARNFWDNAVRSFSSH